MEMKFNLEKPLSIKHNNFPDSVLDTRVVDLLCCRVHNMGKKERSLCKAYKKNGFTGCNLLDCEVDNLKNLGGITAGNIERKLNNKPAVIVVTKYKNRDGVYIWCDTVNIHRLIAYVLVYGQDVTLRNIPIIVADLSSEDETVVYGNDGGIMGDFRNIGLILDRAYSLAKFTNSDNVLSIGYTIRDLIFANMELLQ